MRSLRGSLYELGNPSWQQKAKMESDSILNMPLQKICEGYEV